MTRNLGSLDRTLRAILGILLVGAPFANIPPIWSSPFWAGVAMVAGAILVVTSLIRFCPLYRIFGLSTCRL